MKNRFFKAWLLLLALFSLQACGSSAQTTGTESSGSGDATGVAARGREILDRARVSVVNAVFPGLPSDVPALKTATEPIAPCTASSSAENCDGGGQTATSTSCMQFENNVKEWKGTVTFETCGTLPLNGQLTFTLTLGPIPESCSETFCPWTVPLKLVLTESPDGPMTAGGEPVTLSALFEGDRLDALPELLLTNLQLQIGGYSCHQESGPGSAIVCGNDLDGDGVPDDLDSCPAKFNPSQADTDGDGLGDRCDDNVTGQSEEELACLNKVDVASCVAETDGDCCEGQFCSVRGVCEICSELVGVAGLACRPGHPNDCCPGQFCNVNNQCEPCPSSRGDGAGSFQPVTVCLSLDPFNPNSEACSSDQQCQAQANAGVYDGPLLSGGFDPSSAQPYTCGFPLEGGGSEGHNCCTVITQVVEACQGLPPPDESCAGIELECTGAAAYANTLDLNTACDTVAKDFSDSSASGSCGGTCCTISCSGTESDCSTTGTDYCLSTYGRGSECVDGCCIHSSGDGGGGGGCTGLSGCSQYGSNADAYCGDVAGRGYLCVDDCCIQGPYETNCHDGVDDEPDGAIDCADSDCSDSPNCITCPSGATASTENCNVLGGCSGSQYCNYDGCCLDITCGDYVCSSGEEAGCTDCPESDCSDSVDNNNDGFTDCDDFTCQQDPACGTNYCPGDCTGIGGTCDNGTTAFGFPFFGGNTFCSTPVNTPCPSLAGAPAGFYCGTVNLGDGTTPDQICQATGAPGTLSCVSGCCAAAP